MKVGIIQVATLIGQPHKNMIVLESYIQQAIQEGVDVVVLPETWNVGFFPKDIQESAETTEQSKCVAWLKRMAVKHNVHIVGGSIAIKENHLLFNRCYVFTRDGELVHTYDKTHLFSPGQESIYFHPGDQNSVFELDGVPCAVQICYDLRFPEHARGLALQGAKIMFTPAQWPHPRAEHWDTLNRARAIENQFYVIAANGCGVANGVTSCGHSAIYDPFGEALVRAEEEEGVFVAEIDLDRVDRVRQQIPVFEDRRQDYYERIISS